MKCEKCGDNIEKRSPTCDWQQGRCPHLPPMFNHKAVDNYRKRFYNLLIAIKGWFK